MNHDPQKVLDKAVLGLFRGHASTFLTTIYCSLRFSWSPAIPTACTNGKFLMINFDWFLTLSEGMRTTLIAHELWHVAFMHMGRLLGRNAQVWNMAADYAINLMLTDNGYVFDINPATGKMIGLHDEQYRDMSAEQIYEQLMLNRTKVDLPFGDDFSGEGGDPEGQLTEEEVQSIMANVMRAATLSEMTPGQAGCLPGSLTEMIDKLLNPKIRWERLLSRWLTEQSDQGFTWRKPNRRYQEVYLPSRGGEEGLAHVLWALDVSCSVTSEQLKIFNSEIAGAKDAYSPERMTVATFDHELQRVWEFSKEEDITGLHITGRGGTCMDPIFDVAREIHPTAIIMFSDMECSIPAQIPGIPVLWLCYDNSSWRPPYGDVIHVDSTPTTAT